jgi:hypothetical protein
MNEGIRINLKIDGGNTSAVALRQTGVVLDGETSAPPRGFTFILNPGNPITEFRLRRVRQIQDWQPGEFHARLQVDDDGAFLCRGVDALSLPGGGYEVGLEIADLIAQDQPADVDIPDDGVAQRTLAFKTDPRRVNLTTPVDEFDDAIRAVVDHPDSTLDGLPAADWLANANTKPRPRRKACLLNLLAKLRGAAGVAPKSHLIDNVQSIFFADVDRVYAQVTSGLFADLQKLAANPAKPFYFEGSPKAAIHQQLVEQMQAREPDASLYHLMSFRQEGKPSMQMVIAVPPGGDSTRNHYADLDIDLGNPLQDVEGLLIHFGELLSPGKTDHLKLSEKLYKGALADFSYYSVVTTRRAGA